jgi:hypothetical protein
VEGNAVAWAVLEGEWVQTDNESVADPGMYVKRRDGSTRPATYKAPSLASASTEGAHPDGDFVYCGAPDTQAGLGTWGASYNSAG